MKKKKDIKEKIEIEQTDNGGFIIVCGCVKIALSTKEELIKLFTDFIKDPDKYYKEFNSTYTWSYNYTWYCSTCHQNPCICMWQNNYS